MKMAVREFEKEINSGPQLRDEHGRMALIIVVF